MPLHKFVAEATKANEVKGKSAWGPIKPASPSGAKSPLAEEQPKGPVNKWATPLQIPPSGRAKPSPSTTAPSTRSQSPWATLESSQQSWSADETYDKQKASSAPVSGNNSNKNAQPPSRRGESSTETRKDNEYDTVDFTTPQRDKNSAWDIASPEPVDKKFTDKGKKKAMDFGAADEFAEPSANDEGKDEKTMDAGNADSWSAAPLDWSENPAGQSDKNDNSQWGQLTTPDVKPMDVDVRKVADEQEPASSTAEEKDPRGWSTSGQPESPDKSRRDPRSTRDGESDSRDTSRSRKSTASPVVRYGQRVPGRSDGAWDHSGFATLEPPRKKFDKSRESPRGKYDKSRESYDRFGDRHDDRPKERYDKPRDRYEDKPKDRYNDRSKDKFGDKSKDRFDKPRNKHDKSKGKFDKDKGEKSSTSASSELPQFPPFDWSTLEGQAESWARTPPPASENVNVKDEETIESLDLGERLNVDDWSSKPAGGSKDVAMDVDAPKPGWGEWGPKKKGKGKSYKPVETLETIFGEWGPPPSATSKDASKSSAMDVDAPMDWGEWCPPPSDVKSVQSTVFKEAESSKVDYGEWGPPPPSPKKGSKSTAMDIDEPERDWGEWGPPPPPSHLKKKVQTKVFKPGSSESTPQASEADFGEWGPPPEPKLPKGKLFRTDKPRSNRKDSNKDSWKTPGDSTQESRASDTSWGQWGPAPPSPKKGWKGKQSDTFKSSAKDDTSQKSVGDWGPAPSGPKNSWKDKQSDGFKASKNDPRQTAWGEWGPVSTDSKEVSSETITVKVEPGIACGPTPTDSKEVSTGHQSDAVATKDEPQDSWGACGPPLSESMKGSTAPKAGSNDVNMEIAWGDWGPPPPSTSREEPEAKAPEVDDYTDWGHAPHKTKKFAAKKAEDQNRSRGGPDPGDFEEEKAVPEDDVNVGKLEDWLLPSVSETAVAAVPVKEESSAGDWGAWSTSAPTDSKASQAGLNDWGPAPTESHQNDNYGSKPEDWGMAPEASGSSESKPVFGSRPEDWGLPPEDSGAKHEIGSRVEDWGVTAADMSAWGTPEEFANLTKESTGWVELDPEIYEERGTHKCPTHNWYCKMSMCYDMRRWNKEVQEMQDQGIFVEKDAQPSWRREPGGPPTRHRGAKRGPRVRKKKETRIGRMFGFADIKKEEQEEARREREALKTENAIEVETGENVDVDDGWQAPIGGTAEDWGLPPTSSVNAWA
ncbi:hypothetical protein BDN70DRAFT_295694 [Pholiota conissans]|uniref:Uncharacterized protein n=1 Tax=Pholiota conissans TaxID=109636 RepID=A0A9P5YTH1_9AGAR|nr:hypothetical protein BDN70DRAFT_295694 [Pholiota conissans]